MYHLEPKLPPPDPDPQPDEPRLPPLDPDEPSTDVIDPLPEPYTIRVNREAKPMSRPSGRPVQNGRCSSYWQREAKGRTFPEFRVHPDSAAGRFDNPLAQRQTNSGPRQFFSM